MSIAVEIAERNMADYVAAGGTEEKFKEIFIDVFKSAVLFLRDELESRSPSDKDPIEVQLGFFKECMVSICNHAISTNPNLELKIFKELLENAPNMTMEDGDKLMAVFGDWV